MLVALVLVAIVSVFVAAFALPSPASRHIARIIAGIALAVQVVACLLSIIFLTPGHSPAVLLWIAVGWLVFPVVFTGLGLALTLRNPPHVISVWAVSIALFAMSALTFWSVGAFIGPSALLMMLASVFVLASSYDPNECVCEPARG